MTDAILTGIAWHLRRRQEQDDAAAAFFWFGAVNAGPGFSATACADGRRVQAVGWHRRGAASDAVFRLAAAFGHP